MTCNYVLAANPPQYYRPPAYDAALGGYVFEVGDRIYCQDSTTFKYHTYKCTVAGRYTNPCMPFGPSSATTTVVLGTTTWARVAENSWGNARPTTYPSGYAYEVMLVDCLYGVAAGGYYPSNAADGTMVFVDPDTMRPRNWQGVFVSGASNGGRSNIFFGSTVIGGRRARAPLLGEYPAVATTGNQLGEDSAAQNLNAMPGSAGGASVTLKGAVPITGAFYSSFGLNIYDPSGILEQVGQALDTTSSGAMCYSQRKLPYETWPPCTTYPTLTLSTDMYYYATSRYAMLGTARRQAGWRTARANLVAVENVYRGASFHSNEVPFSLDVFCATTAGTNIPIVITGITLANVLTGLRTVKLRILTTAPLAAVLTDAHIFMEVSYPSSTTMANYSFSTTANANYGMYELVGSPVTIEAATGWTYPVTTYPSGVITLEKSITIARPGAVHVRLTIAANLLAPWRMYIDPAVEII